MGAKSDYVTLRNARVLENQARLASLGLWNRSFASLPENQHNRHEGSEERLRDSQKRTHVRESGSISFSGSSQNHLSTWEATASAKPKSKRSWNKEVYGITPLRHSQRINTTDLNGNGSHLPLRRSQRLRGSKIDPSSPKQVVKVDVSEDGEVRFPSESEDKRPANAPLIILEGTELQLSAEASAVRCNSKGRGSVYNPVFGICCHFCRQKKLCDEEDCKRCGNFDVNEPCIGNIS
ncbi:hypothetical protein K1719_023845 [Acacia pycnantha]|nr:hypothetical protein K1719_023845 [Acacia pycnantha]